MDENFKITKNDSLLEKDIDRSLALLDDVYSLSKPIAATLATFAAVTAGYLVLHKLSTGFTPPSLAVAESTLPGAASTEAAAMQAPNSVGTRLSNDLLDFGAKERLRKHLVLTEASVPHVSLTPSTENSAVISIRRPPLGLHENLVLPPIEFLNGKTTTSFKGNVFLFQEQNLQGRLILPMGFQAKLPPGVFHETVLDTASRMETTYFSNGAAMRLNHDGVAQFWSPSSLNKELIPEYFNGSKGALYTINPTMGRYQAVIPNKSIFERWKNGLEVEQYAGGQVKIDNALSQLNNSHMLVFDAKGQRVSTLYRGETDYTKFVRTTKRNVDGTVSTHLGNGLSIKEFTDGKIQLFQKQADTFRRILTANRSGAIDYASEFRI